MGPSLLLALSLGLAPQDVPVRPHVVFVLIDTCRADGLGLYREDRETTPFLSRLAADAIVFDRCRSQAPWTKPSMAALLTSRYPSEVGIHSMFQRLDDRWTLLPEALSAAGWHTAGFSTNPLMGEFSNYIQGFDEFVESTAINRGDPIRFASGAAAKVAKKLSPWLEHAPAERPTFLYLHLVDPHEEYEPAPEFLQRFADPARHDQYREEWARLIKTKPPIPGLHVTPWNFEQAQVDAASFIEHGKNLYDADILACDAALEGMWTALTEAWGENVILVLTSDHGEEFMEHDGTSHGFCLYDELVHVPLMIYAPGLFPAGRRVPDAVRSIDIYPTLLDLLGAPPQRGLRGRSLVPLMEGRELEPLPVFTELVEDTGSRTMGEPMGIAHAVIDGRWKLIRNLRNPVRLERPTLELYDLEADPGEQHNLAQAEPEVAARLADLVDLWCAASLGLAAPAADLDEVDPDVLAQLERLGYSGGDEEDAGPSDGGKLSLMVRAVLEGAERWTLHALDPSAEVPAGTSQRKLVAGYLLHDRGRVKDEEQAALLEVVYRGLAAGVEPRGDGPFLPLHGIRSHHRGHTVDLLIDFESRRVRVRLDGVDVADLATAKGASRGVAAAFLAARVDVLTRE